MEDVSAGQHHQKRQKDEKRSVGERRTNPSAIKAKRQTTT